MAFLSAFNNGLDRLTGLFGSPQLPQGGVLGEPQIQQAYDPKLAMATQLLAGSNSGKGFNEILASALMAGQQSRQQSQQAIAQQRESQSQEALRQAQIQKLQNPDMPNNVQEYQFAVKNGYKGTFQDWQAIGNNVPVDKQMFEYYKGLSPEDKAMYDKLNGRQQSPYYQWVQRVMPDGSTQQGTFNARTGATEWGNAIVPAGQQRMVDARGAAIGGAQGDQAGKAPAQASFGAAVNNMLDSIGTATQGGTMGVKGKAGYLFDYDNAVLFDNRVQQLSTELRTVFRIQGEGTLSDQEQKQYGLQLPSRNLSPETNRQILNDLQNRVRLRMQTPIGPWAGGNPSGGADIASAAAAELERRKNGSK